MARTARPTIHALRHCEERSNTAIHTALPFPEHYGNSPRSYGLLRNFAPRNDEICSLVKPTLRGDYERVLREVYFAGEVLTPLLTKGATFLRPCGFPRNQTPRQEREESDGGVSFSNPALHARILSTGAREGWNLKESVPAWPRRTARPSGSPGSPRAG
jgi:hypothetical protein